MFALFPEILHQSESGDIETLALLVRKYFGDAQTFAPRLRLPEVFAQAGVELRQDSVPGVARLEAWDAKGQYRVVCSLSPKLTNTREQNYALAHILGHVFLDLHPKMAKGELQRSIFEEAQSPLHRFLREGKKLSAQEAAADAFACALLLPRGMVRKAYATLSGVEDTAAFFHVDRQLLELRLSQIGISDRAPADAQANPKAKARPPAQTKAAEPAPSVASKPKREAKAAPAELDPSSVARVTRNVAALSYRREEQRTDPSAAPAKSEQDAPGDKGMERLRKLARKIDKSVDV